MYFDDESFVLSSNHTENMLTACNEASSRPKNNGVTAAIQTVQLTWVLAVDTG